MSRYEAIATDVFTIVAAIVLALMWAGFILDITNNGF
jgi:hypothetical protein